VKVFVTVVFDPNSSDIAFAASAHRTLAGAEARIAEPDFLPDKDAEASIAELELED
jgi:hypothetical protein